MFKGRYTELHDVTQMFKRRFHIFYDATDKIQPLQLVTIMCDTVLVQLDIVPFLLFLNKGSAEHEQQRTECNSSCNTAMLHLRWHLTRMCRTTRAPRP